MEYGFPRGDDFTDPKIRHRANISNLMGNTFNSGLDGEGMVNEQDVSDLVYLILDSYFACLEKTNDNGEEQRINYDCLSDKLGEHVKYLMSKQPILIHTSQ